MRYLPFAEYQKSHFQISTLVDTGSSINLKNKEERYSRVPRLSDTPYSAKEYLEYQIPVTQLKGQRENGDSDTPYSAKGTKGKYKGTKGKWRYAIGTKGK